MRASTLLHAKWCAMSTAMQIRFCDRRCERCVSLSPQGRAGADGARGMPGEGGPKASSQLLVSL